MPIDTNLSVAPWFDDFSINNEYYQILFKPKISVQARELNQMQTILRNQIEQFGDAIYQVGTIIDGCNFNFHPCYPFVKIKDLTTDGLNVTLANYIGLFTKNSANLQAIIVNSYVGFETTPPDLNTLYLSYRNSGDDANTFQYTAGDILTIFDSNTGIWAVTVNNAGVGFSNSDAPVFTPALAVNVSTGSFTNGEYITQPSTGANLQIIGIDTTSLANVGQIVVKLKPRGTDLANSSANGSQWAVANNDTIRNSGNTAVGSVMAVVGRGASAAVVTDGSGRVISVPMTGRGNDYTILPTVTIKSPNNASGVASLSLVAQNYVTKVTVANTAAVGKGYAFGVSEGTIYQKGLFLKVDAQTIIVDKYDTTPNNVSIGFRSTEQIINSNIDTSLLDNASGFPNFQAPGADRLKITPQLYLQSTDTSDPDFMPIVSFSEGNPFRQNQVTAYSAIGDEMAQTEYETNGDFVLSRFEVTSRSPFTQALEATKLSIISNPGSAYIKGRRVFNNTNYSIDINKTTDTSTSNSRYITLNYGNWIRLKELGGVFQFSTGDVVTFYDTPRQFISNTAAVSVGNTTPLGTALGTARIRSLTHEYGIPGDAQASYRLYMFEIALNAGVNFADIRAISYSGTYTGIADVVLSANAAVLANTDYDYLLFHSGATTLKNATNVTYTYRTIDQTATFANTGLLSKTIAATPGETFPYVGSLTVAQLQDLYLVPVGGALQAAANATGTCNTLTTSANITGNATTWLNDFVAGDYAYVYANSTVHDVRRVLSVTNNVFMTLDANVAFSLNNNALYRYFPKNAPLPLGLRSGLTANVSANAQVLTVNLGMALTGATSVNTAIATNILRTNVSAATKSAGRDQLVKICTSNNIGSTAGPWCLGVSDIFRLKRVYMSGAATVNAASSDVTSYFYIDHKQNEDYLDIGYLYLRPNSGLTITNGNYLLAQFDAFQASGTGFFDTVSYTGANAAVIAATDSTPLANLASSVSSWEIPECFSSRGTYFDLNKYFDFRPIVANTATPTTNPATAPLNPVYGLSFGNTADPTNDKKFPLPDSALQYDMEQYLYRTDSVFCGKNGKIFVVRGLPSVTQSLARVPVDVKDAIRLVNVYLPPYPCIPATVSNMQGEILTTRIGNINYLAARQARSTIAIPSRPGTPYDTQPRAYSMAAVGQLERRIAALEYYGSLSALQTDMINRVVPSSIDGTTNRFKFGFFADDFSGGISQDVTNPGYAAAISGSNMTPPTIEWVVGYGEAKAASVPYVDAILINQPDATVPIPPPVIVVEPPKPPAPTTTSVPIWLLRTDHLAPSASGQVNLTDYAYPQFATVNGTAALYFHIPQTAQTFLSGAIVDPDNFQIYQGNALVADAYTNAVDLTAADQAYLKSAAVPGNFFGATAFAPLSRPAAGWVNGSGKILFNHIASSGINYTIVGLRANKYDHWMYGLQYPSQFGQTVVLPPSTTASSYMGVMDVQPATLLLALTPPPSDSLFIAGVENGVNSSVEDLTDYTAIGSILVKASSRTIATGQPAFSTTFQPQSFGITCYGLRPLTHHACTLNGLLKSSRCAQVGKNIGDMLISDQYGILRFTYYFNGVDDQDVTNIFIGPLSNQVQWGTEQAASVVQPISTGALTMVVYNGAAASYAQFNLAVVADPELVLSTITTGVTSVAFTQGYGSKSWV